MTIQEFNDFIDAHDWRYAKSMPQMPHAYVVREKCRSDDEFVRAVTFIRKHGYPKKFFRQTYVYFDNAPFTYWTMGAPLNITTILNRALI